VAWGSNRINTGAQAISSTAMWRRQLFGQCRMCVRQMRPPGRGDFSFGDFSHAPSPKNLSKNGFCSRKGVAFLRKAVLQKNFYLRERIPLSALAFGCSHACLGASI
jgi:hypothetical protein